MVPKESGLTARTPFHEFPAVLYAERLAQQLSFRRVLPLFTVC